MSYSFESPKVFDKLRLPADSELRQGIVISNPLGEDYSVNEYQYTEWNAQFSGYKL